MDSRRDFIKKAALAAAGGGLTGIFPASIQRALAIDPSPGSTWQDAEHVVILMQENRSFDHCYGTLRGVRGFGDPRAITLPDGNPVWLQSNKLGETYAPFRLNIHDTKATWLGSLPHSWTDQAQARNGGRHDGWLDAKRSGHKEYTHLPLTLGFYNREDLPFFYDFADAFTICDQNFCSSLTGTMPNRLHLWTGTVREKPSVDSKACIRNEDSDYDSEVSWMTFPERLEDQGISWRIYQNELSLPTGLNAEERAWLGNFEDNPIEYFTQYHVRCSATFRADLQARERTLSSNLARWALISQPDDKLKKRIAAAQADLAQVRRDRVAWTDATFAKLTPREKSLHLKAFTTNIGDPHYRQLATLTYNDGAVEREMRVPKGDLLHQFREDVRQGRLPAVSWIVPPENFSDHPSAPWYGAWYLSETLDILTQNPEVWRKTIFILCYDENDGYFDHVPPFVPPHPTEPGSGKASAGVDVAAEHVSLQQEREHLRRHPDSAMHSGPIGLGFRVPLIIASPWSRGGYVCSQVFDHTSILQFLEKWLGHKGGQPVRESNISSWRRTVCGDLTSVFRPYHGEKIPLPAPVERKAFLSSIHQAKFKQVPNGFRKLSAEDIANVRGNSTALPWMPRQEGGVRAACPLPYELEADAVLAADRQSIQVQFSAGNELFGSRAAGAPFHVYTPAKIRLGTGATELFEAGLSRSYAVSAGDRLSDAWRLQDFQEGRYHLRVHGPNGFYREFIGTTGDPGLKVELKAERTGKIATGNAVLLLGIPDGQPKLTVELEDMAYGGGKRTITLLPTAAKDHETSVPLDLTSSHGWYDFRLSVPDAASFGRRYAGRIESGKESVSDPLLAGSMQSGGK